VKDFAGPNRYRRRFNHNCNEDEETIMASLPGWNSVETTSSLHDFFELGGIILFLVVVGFELLAYVYGHRERDLISAAESVSAIQAQQKQEALQRQLNEAQAQLGAADKKVAELQEFQAQRHLSPEQKSDLVAALSKFPGTKIAAGSLMGDDDGKIYRDDFVDVFNKAGWALDGHVGEAMFDKNPVGVIVRVNQAEVQAGRIPVAAAALAEALTELGITQRTPDGKIPMSAAADQAVDRIGLIVGVKPRQ
jgi:hypothetical protein